MANRKKKNIQMGGKSGNCVCGVLKVAERDVKERNESKAFGLQKETLTRKTQRDLGTSVEKTNRIKGRNGKVRTATYGSFTGGEATWLIQNLWGGGGGGEGGREKTNPWREWTIHQHKIHGDVLSGAMTITKKIKKSDSGRGGCIFAKGLPRKQVRPNLMS